MMQAPSLLTVLAWATLISSSAGLGAATIPVASLERNKPVDFASEVLPILRNNCLACHNQTKAKADLVLETPQTILKGSENGPVIVPGQSETSLLLRVAAHQAKPLMPPHENKVAAHDLTSQELGLIKLWIDQGAHGEVPHSQPVVWQPLAASYKPIYAAALTPDGQVAACSRANQICIYQLPTGRLLSCLSDPQLPKALAHRDSVHALAFSPDGTLLASGGYREVKLWRRSTRPPTVQIAPRTNELTAVALSVQGDWLATGDQDGDILLTQLPLGQVRKTLHTCHQPIQCLQFSPDGQHLLSGSEDHTLRVWDVSKGALLARTETDSALTALAWLDAGQTVAAGTARGEVHLWALPSQASATLGKIAELQAGEEMVLSLQGIPNCPEELLSAGLDGVVRVWDLKSKRLVRSLKHGAPVVALAAREDGSRYAAVGLDNTLTLWAGESDQPIARLKGDRHAQERLADKQRALRFATNEVSYCQTAFAAAEKEHQAQTDRLRKATETLATAEKSVTEKKKQLDEAVHARAEAEKALTELTTELAKAKELYDSAETAAEQARLELMACVNTLAQAGGRADAAAGSSMSAGPCTPRQAMAEWAAAQLVAKARAAGEAKLQFDRVASEKKGSQKQHQDKVAAAKKQTQDLETELKKARQAQANADNEFTLAIASAQKAADRSNESQNAIPLAQAENKRIQVELEVAERTSAASDKPIRVAAFSPDGIMLATGGDDGRVHTWSAAIGQACEVLPQHQSWVQALAFPSAREIVSASVDGAVDEADLDPAWTLDGVLGTGESDSALVDRVNALAFSPDGQTLATGGGEPSRSGQIQLWTLASGRLSQEFNNVHSDTVLGLEFSRNGQYLACSGADRFMKVIDLSAGKVVRSFEGHTHHVLGVAWKQDGRTLATAGADAVVKIWDFRTGERRKNVEGFEKEVTSISCFAGENFLVSSGDHQVRLLNEKGETVRTLGDAKGFLYTAAATPNGQRIIAGGQDGILRVWDGRKGDLIAELPAP